jgi:hypothetical protein
MLVAIVTIIISVIVVFNHQLVWLLAVFPGLYIAYVFLLLHTKAPTLREGFYLTETEKEVWKMHHVAIRFPFAARTRAGALSALQFISIILAIALVVAGAYWGLAFALGWFILAPLTTRTNPIIPYSNAAQRGNLNATKRLEALKSLEVKLKSPGKHAKAKASDGTKDGYNLVNKYLKDRSNASTSDTKPSHRTPPKIAIIGIGGAGVATINRFASIGRMPTKRFIVIDNDTTAIKNSKAATKITLEKSEGSIDDIKAKMIVYAAKDEIIKATSGAGVDVAFIIVGTGGKTGFHAWNIVAEMLQEKGILTIVFAIKPFSFEEGYRHLNATVASKSQSGIDIFVEVSNDRMLQAVPKSTPLHEAFKIMDYTLVDAIKGVYDCISSGSKDKRKIQAIINRFVLNLVDNHE